MSNSKFPRGIKDVEDAANRSGRLAERRQNGSHVILKSTNGNITVAPDRNEYPPGTRASIRKMMYLCGFIIFFLVPACAIAAILTLGVL